VPNAFLDPVLVHGSLYADATRLERRTSVLRAAKIVGPDAADTIVDLLKEHAVATTVIADIGCGRGTTTRRITDALAPRAIIAIDTSRALLGVVAARVPEATCIAGDFHALPLTSGICDAVVAAFCIYHSRHPAHAIAEVGRCLNSSGIAVMVTKSVNSYTELSTLVAASGLDPSAHSRPSLYGSFHSANAADLARMAFRHVSVRTERHLFRFAGYAEIAQYLATTPRYELSTGTQPRRIELALRRWRPDHAVVASSTITYVIGSGPR
jgi:ubiquinone/menaquinone biosynthesis C-methylase UbiE